MRIKELAEKLGVSTYTVSVALSGKSGVSEATRKRVVEAAARFGYQPDNAGRMLRSGRSCQVGVVMPPWNNPYIAELCMGIQACLTARNYTPVFAVDNTQNPVPGNLEKLLSLRIAGLITVASSLLPDDVALPVVSYFFDDPRFDSVCPDPELDSRQIIAYLKACGHRKIGYLGWMKDLRLKWLISEAERCGLDFPPRWRLGARHPLTENLFERLLETNRGKDLPTALIIHNDAMALKTIRHIHEAGFRIPEDFSVIGHDNTSYCASSIPALTSMSCGPIDKIASALVDLLLARIKDPGRPREKVLLRSELVRRESVANLNNMPSKQGGAQ